MKFYVVNSYIVDAIIYFLLLLYSCPIMQAALFKTNNEINDFNKIRIIKINKSIVWVYINK